MKKRKYSVSAWALSSLFSALAGMLLIAFIWPFESDVNRIVWMAGFFPVVFLGGFCGMRLALKCSKRYELQYPKHWIGSVLLSVVLVSAVGAGGQALFMYSREEVSIPAQVDMVLLLDASGSMGGSNSRARTDAACQFVDGLSGEHSLQVIAFAGTILDQSALTATDDAGKQTLKTMIQSIDSTGTTDFDEPLTLAANTLQNQGRPGCSQAVLLLTDGKAPISDDVINAYITNGIHLFSVRIDTSEELYGHAKELADAAVRTGGSDTRLAPGANGSVDAADMLKAFQDAFQATTELRTNMDNELVICSQDATPWQFAVRTVTLVLCMVIFGFGYFGRISFRTLFGHILTGAVLSFILTVMGSSYSFCFSMLFLVMAAAYVSIDLQTEEGAHV